ncbi:MAG: 1-acyl-sn-glycerol-3-phosphate acyltransferase [Acidobacteria bacterium]|nr:1-acyl-sn-glycerol-3-phosphate acyltransferase [Acidobacteriota bacterium]MBV9145364.1 1-acyl-sn-glycerol-3-phosphate acyltransferase [Acidobacteriota bacterium]MBV9437076.1 1-acyl-sn-glycerol-3-phosphate acyltransferase [Acidobacteriota bacterium]
MMAALRSSVAFLFTCILTPLGALIGFPATWITGSADLLYAIAMWIARTGLKIAGVAVQVEGKENLDAKATYIFMCNHVSNLDPPVLITRLPKRTSVLVKKELFKVPVLGQAMRMGDLVSVDRSNREAALESMRQAVDMMKRGLNMTIFPEGTRSRDGRLLPFKKGPFYLAMDSGVPVVPVTILGSENLMGKGSVLIRPGTVRLVFHAPLLPENFAEKENLIEAVRQGIASALPPALREANLDAPA